MSQQTEERRLPAIPGNEVERLAAGIGRFAAGIIDSDAFSDDEKVAAYMHAAHMISDITKYTCRNYLEQPDVVELHAAMAMLRNMLAERGLVRRDDDREGLEPCA
jgi:hypothetical protein